MKETSRRRQLQVEYNEEHGIVPRTIIKTAEEILKATSVADSRQDAEEVIDGGPDGISYEEMISRLERDMLKAAEDLEFEKAASIRDRIEDVLALAALESEGKRKTASRRKKGRRRR